MNKQGINDGSEDLLNSFLTGDAPEEVITPLEDKTTTDKPKEKGEEDFSGEMLGEGDIEELLKEAPVEKDEEDETEEKDKPTSDTEETEYNFKAVAAYLAEEGAIDFEDSEEIENTPEVIKNAVVKTADKLVSQYKEQLPEVVQDLVNYIEKGGKPEHYLTSLQRDIDLDNVDLEDVSDQKLLVAEYLKLQGLDADDVSETVQGFEDGLILDKQAKIASKQLEKYYENRTAQTLKQQEEADKQERAQHAQQIESIKKEISTSEVIAGLPITKEQKTAFTDYLLKPNKSGVTGYEAELQEDPIKTAIELAWLKFNKYDFTKATKQAKTEISKNLKEMFKKTESTPKGKSLETGKATKANDFSAFGKMFAKN